MGLTTDKIMKLRELADRGEGGEKENAKRILTKNGVDWRKPKETVVNTIKSTFGFSIINEYFIPITVANSILLVLTILIRLNIKNKDVNTRGNKIYFRCTPGEHDKIISLYNKNITKFDQEMYNYAFRKIEMT